jgi:heterodisulfide reductase subunit B
MLEMPENERVELSYFPGCSMATSAKESNLSLMEVTSRLGLKLIELEDWNCCGSSSAHSLDQELAFHLTSRNLSLADPGRPLMIMCPTCLHRHQLAHKRIKEDPEFRAQEEKRWGRPISPELKIFHFFEVLSNVELSRLEKAIVQKLNGLKFVPYYGCMLARPPALRRERNYHQLMEKILSGFGAEPLPWAYSARCCGTFLAAARPDVATPLVNRIIEGAKKAGAECIITACAMCQLNLEIRCSLDTNVPVLHLSEILALVLGAENHRDWFKRHLVDPCPVLKEKGLLH